MPHGLNPLPQLLPQMEYQEYQSMRQGPVVREETRVEQMLTAFRGYQVLVTPLHVLAINHTHVSVNLTLYKLIQLLR